MLKISDAISSCFSKIGQFFSFNLHFENPKLVLIFAFVLLLTVCLCLTLIWYVRSTLKAIEQEKEIERQNRRLVDNRLDKPAVDNGKAEAPAADLPSDKAVTEPMPKGKNKTLGKKAQPFDFDWKRHKDEAAADIPEPSIFSYQLKPQKLENLLGLIVDLCERKMDDLKMAQIVMYKNQHLNSEDDIIQTITAVKYFIFLCTGRRFQKLTEKKVLPHEDAAIFHLANGDCSLALALLEELIDFAIKKVSALPAGREQNKAWAEISNYATIFGTLALFCDTHLAEGAFELAIELYPRNVTAWGRLGDAAVRRGDNDTAIWAYSNVLNIADDGIYTQQIANANKMIALYHLEDKRKQDAAALQKAAAAFYDSININKPLTQEEIDILQFMESKREENLEGIIDGLFSEDMLTDNKD